MSWASGRFATLAVVTLVSTVCAWPERAGRAADDPPPKTTDPALAGSTIVALLDANDGKTPATGRELWQALTKLGEFTQLPVVFSAVRLDSGIENPRVVITPQINGLSGADATEPSLNGRLYLAANMEKNPNGGDPRVTSVEFISWNVLSRRFDFGVIEHMGTAEPVLRVLDGGRCFACHKSKGPILGAKPWTNTTEHKKLRVLVAEKHRLVDAVPPGAAGAGLRDRIDGMALVAPQAQTVDNVVRVGALQRLNRDTFRLMNQHDGGRKAFVAMLVAITHAGPLDPNDRTAKVAVDRWGFEQSYLRFAKDWVALTKTTNTGVLVDFAPIPKNLYEWADEKFQKLPPPPARGFRDARDAQFYKMRVDHVVKWNEVTRQKQLEKLRELLRYDAARATGKHGMPSEAQPSNPSAFIQLPARATQKPSGMVNPLMLAHTIGLTEGDRKFMADSLADGAKRLTKLRGTPATLAKEVFEGAEFADVRAGGPLPDRDDFKDRFVAGLNALLTTRYKQADGFAPDRHTYAHAPRRDPKLLDEIEAAVVPTSACLRCHEVRGNGKERQFDPIPPLAFDPLDKQARVEWMRTASPERKQEVLTRFLERLVADADMPPRDAPEYDAFRVKQAAAFDDAKRYLEAGLVKDKQPPK